MLIPDNMKKKFANILALNLEDWGGTPICDDRFYSRKDIERVSIMIARQAIAWALSQEEQS